MAHLHNVLWVVPLCHRLQQGSRQAADTRKMERECRSRCWALPAGLVAAGSIGRHVLGARPAATAARTCPRGATPPGLPALPRSAQLPALVRTWCAPRVSRLCSRRAHPQEEQRLGGKPGVALSERQAHKVVVRRLFRRQRRLVRRVGRVPNYKACHDALLRF